MDKKLMYTHFSYLSLAVDDDESGAYGGFRRLSAAFDQLEEENVKESETDSDEDGDAISELGSSRCLFQIHLIPNFIIYFFKP
jgi:hypothetical protein